MHNFRGTIKNKLQQDIMGQSYTSHRTGKKQTNKKKNGGCLTEKKRTLCLRLLGLNNSILLWKAVNFYANRPLLLLIPYQHRSKKSVFRDKTLKLSRRTGLPCIHVRITNGFYL